MQPRSGKKIFPVYTKVGNPPVTICKSIDAGVFGYPFFNQGVQQRSPLSEDNTMYGWEDLQMDGETSLLQLKGFIFHSSHCGSTLLSRMLGRLPGVRVISETEAINGLLLSCAFNNLTEKNVLVQLKQIMEAYRQPLENEKFLVFKLSSWNVFFIKLFQQLYPDIPWFYLDRDTDEVVNSLLKKGGGFAEWWDHPADILRQYFTGKDVIFPGKEDYLREMVKRHRLYAQSNNNGRSCFLQYPEFIGQFEEIILPNLGLHFSKDEIRDALLVARYESKQVENVLFNPSGKEGP